MKADVAEPVCEVGLCDTKPEGEISITSTSLTSPSYSKECQPEEPNSACDSLSSASEGRKSKSETTSQNANEDESKEASIMEVDVTPDVSARTEVTIPEVKSAGGGDIAAAKDSDSSTAKSSIVLEYNGKNLQLFLDEECTSEQVQNIVQQLLESGNLW